MLALIEDIFSRRNSIFELAKRDFQQQFQGSYLGFIWAFLQPLLFISMLYIIFEFGFRSGRGTSVPFSVYLISGMISWQYFSNNLSSTTGVFRSYAFLIKKIDFRLSTLPLIKILSSLPVHVLLIGTAIVLSWLNGYPPSFYTLQLFYYFLGLSLLLLGIGLLTASTNIFVKDVSNIIAVLLQFGFWLTPIFWNIEMLPHKYQSLIKLNPMYYIVTGYRESIALHIPFWSKPYECLYFWSLVLFFLAFGISVYRKLKPHFAEVI